MPPFDSSPTQLLIWALVGYGLGAIPFGLVLAQLMGLGNLRQIGSGNIGATNVLRTGNKLAAALTLILDGGKGVVAVLLARTATEGAGDVVQLTALAAFLGHCYPIWLRFSGGKGVATFLGLWLALAWPVGVACCLTWLAAVAMTRISSMGALVAGAASTVWVVLLTPGDTFVLGVALTLLLFWRHRGNIARLRAGTEPRIGRK
ncbi:MAG TPA: acyl-phosphate glycerol 3-phosphate acyltransferase [Rhodobacteraceae bacterium]|nr:acyl-phosphate glycerol 3-phosphate acyltransferase [Paracoccaceae bacterium]